MASSPYKSTPETTNTNRVNRAFLGPCTDGLRDILRHYVPPSTFPRVIKQNKLNLPRLTADQQNLILPRHGNYIGTYDDMDISLLYILLRNITNMPPHSNGWNNEPDPIDRSLSANIERVRLIRNRWYGHSVGASMSISDFQSIWSAIRSVMVDVDTFLGNGNIYEEAVDFLHSESMDPELNQHYENEIRKQVEEDRTTRKFVINLENQMKQLTKSVIPQNVREQYDIGIQKWREEDKLYYETHSFPTVMAKVRNHPCVTFVGVPGSGKSATAHHIALKLEEEGYEVVPTKDIRKMEDYGDPRNPQVFVIDDVVGVFGLQETELKVLINYEQKITQPCMVKSRTLITCREAVYNETLPYKPFLTNEETVIKLHSSDHALDANDKKEIFKKYGLNENQMSPALLTSTSYMFPLLCKLFSKETKFKALGFNFFLNPIQCIIDELDDMQKHNILNYVTLVLCMLNENILSEDILEDQNNENFKNMKTNTLKYCKLETQTNTFKFVKALSAMEGTYTKRSGAQYTFIHDSMFEICAFHYGKQFPVQMLLHMSSSYIANYVKPQTNDPGIAHKAKEKESDSQSCKGDKSNNDSDRKKESDGKMNERDESFDLCVRLREDQYPPLAERLYRDIQNMELYDVFRNPVLKHPQVCQAFIGVLETKSYKELKSLFLFSHGEVDKIVSKRGCVEKESEEREEWEERREWWRQDVLVDKRKKRDDEGKLLYGKYTYNVRVISWVIYYGHYQIIEYVIQQTEQHNKTRGLFEITGHSHQFRNWMFKKIKKKNYNRKLKVERYRLLVLGCYSGDVYTIRLLLPFCKREINGIDKISEDIYWCYDTPLTAACEGGHLRIVEELVTAGADVNLKDTSVWENTPLIAACKRGDVRVVEELMNAEADVNLKDIWGYTPLIVACKRGHVSVVEELMKVEANVNLKGRKDKTPLIAACEGGSVSVVRELMKAGNDVNLPEWDDNTPLITACKGGHVSVVKELMKAGADVNLQDNKGKTPLIAACKGGHVSVVKELVKARADVNLQEWGGNTPLIIACMGGHASIVEELVKAGIDVNIQDRDGNMPMLAACEGGHVSVVEKLAKVGADANLKGRKRNALLIAACYRGHVRMVEELVKAGADVNLQDDDDDTPLIAAVRECSLQTVKYLVEHGANWVTQVVDINVSVVYAALILNKPDIVKYFVKEQNKIIAGKLTGNVHLFNCLVDIRHAGVKTDSRDDLVVTEKSVWCMNYWGDLWRTIRRGDCDVLRRLLCVGLDASQSIQFYDKHINCMYKDMSKICLMYKDMSDVRPLLCTLIDEDWFDVKHRTEKVNILLGVGADVNVRVRYREYGSVLDREGVSVLERTKRRMFEYSRSKYHKYRVSEFKEVMCEIKKHVRRHSV